MTKVFIIAIVMWWADITETPVDDSLEISHLDGELLYFRTEGECYNHINDNVTELKEYGLYRYPSAQSVKTILCVEKEMHIGENA